MGVHKEDLPLPGGGTMIDRVIKALDEVCLRVVTVGGRRHQHLEIIHDIRPGAGPLGGIEAILASGLDTQYLVCPSDTPLIAPGLLRRLTIRSDSIATIFEVEGDRNHSLPLRISSAALDTVTAALNAGQNAIHRVLTRLDLERLTITNGEAATLMNVNTPGDYTAI